MYWQSSTLCCSLLHWLIGTNNMKLCLFCIMIWFWIVCKIVLWCYCKIRVGQTDYDITNTLLGGWLYSTWNVCEMTSSVITTISLAVLQNTLMWRWSVYSIIILYSKYVWSHTWLCVVVTQSITILCCYAEIEFNSVNYSLSLSC